MNIAVIGTGYVGLITGACFADYGVSVVCADTDGEKIKSLEQGIVPFYEPGADELVGRNMKAGRLQFTTDVANAIKNALIVFIAVGTPQGESGKADMKFVDAVAKVIGQNMTGYKVVVTKSTVPVGTGERVRKIIAKNLSKKCEFDVVSNPEFLREGAAIEDSKRPNRIVIGVDNSKGKAAAIMRDLYRPLYLIETPIIITSVETAELIKYASNAFLATKISFINEMAVLCEKVGANVQVVAKGMGLDRRIGTKFLHAGPGYGGSCFPKDTNALAQIGEEYGVKLGVVQAAIKANEKQKYYAIEKISRASKGNIKGKTVCILGLSFKPETNDIRDAPALFILRELLRCQARITVYDPQAMDDAKREFPQITYCEDAYEAAKGADILVIVTEWNQFRNLDLEKIKKLMKGKVFVDLRNIYESEKMRKIGFHYHSIGRK